MTAQVEVDTMRLRGRVKDAESMRRLSAVSAQRAFSSDGDGTTLRLVAGRDVLRSGARVGVDLMHDGAPEGWVEFSAPKIGTGSNVVAMPLRQALDVARDVYDEAGDLVEWSDRFEHMRVQRVDVDRDFEDVDQQDVLLAGLARVKAPYSPKTRLYPDAERSNATTLTRGPASRWLATLYSKEGESKHRLRHARDEVARKAAQRDVASAEGRLRYELRLRPDVMGKRLRLVRDLNEEDLAGLRRQYFDRVGYGLEVTGMQRAAALVMGHDEWRVDARMALLGYLFCQAQGLPPDLSRNIEARYRKRSRDVGVGAADLVDLATSSTVRLDFDKGKAVNVA